MGNPLTKLPRVLFFIDGSVPTFEEQLEAEKMAPCRVSFRNARLVPEEGALEDCDAVAGKAPKRYKDARPSVKQAVEQFEKERKEAYEQRRDEGNAAKKAGLDATAKEAEALAKKAADDKKKADEAAKKAKEEADAKAKAAAAWKPNA